jgi:hypothetical protein
MHKQLLFLFFAIIFYQSGFAQIDKMEGYPEYRNDSCYFEGECNFIQPFDSSNIWQIAKPGKLFLNEAYSPDYCLITDSISPYPPNHHDYAEFIISRDLGFERHNLFIQFWQKHQFDEAKDCGSIWMAFDTSEFHNIVNWNDVYLHYDYFESIEFFGYKYEASSVVNSDTGYAGSSEFWKYTEIFITIEAFAKLAEEYSIKSDIENIILRFYINSDSIDGGEEGWAIDNLVFGGYYGSEINNLQQSLLLKTYPNPVADQLYIYAANSSNQKFELNIKNIMGETVLQMPEIYSVDGNLNCNMSTLPKGIYVIELNNTEKKYSGKIVKQ